ncbi:MAG: DUF116 domain-containing protein [candidate division NC10 bacterium]
MTIKPRKRLFLGLLLALEIIIALGLFMAWFIPSQGYASYGRNLSVFMAWVVGAIVLTFTLGIIFLVIIILRGKEVRGARGLRGILIRYLLPVIIPIGKLFGIPKDDIRRSFIEINNELVRSSSFKAPPKRVLVLMPHCVQLIDCPYRITVNVNNCRQCGKCDFSDLTAIADKLGVEITVATGGSLARRVVVESNPELIVGIACERDLSAGIVDTYPIPVIGVLLDRPEGPCINTRVSVDRVAEALQNFLPEGFFAGEQKTETVPAS